MGVLALASVLITAVVGIGGARPRGRQFTEQISPQTQDGRRMIRRICDGIRLREHTTARRRTPWMPMPHTRTTMLPRCPNKSWNLQFNVRINSCDWSAGLDFGLFDSRLSYPWGAIEDQSVADGGNGTALVTEGVGAGVYSPAWTTGTWYHSVMKYDTTTNQVTLTVTNRSTGSLLQSQSQTVTSFPAATTYLGVSRVHANNVNLGETVNYNLDNVVLSQVVPLTIVSQACHRGTSWSRTRNRGPRSAAPISTTCQSAVSPSPTLTTTARWRSRRRIIQCHGHAELRGSTSIRLPSTGKRTIFPRASTVATSVDMSPHHPIVSQDFNADGNRKEANILLAQWRCSADVHLLGQQRHSGRVPSFPPPAPSDWGVYETRAIPVGPWLPNAPRIRPLTTCPATT